MPVRTEEYDHFIFIVYSKETNADYTTLKEKLLHFLSTYDGEKDFIIDLTRCKMVNSLEIGIFARVLSRAKEAKRCLRLITNDDVRESFDELPMFMGKYLVYYESTQAFTDELKRYQGQPLPSPATSGENDSNNTHDT